MRFCTGLRKFRLAENSSEKQVNLTDQPKGFQEVMMKLRLMFLLTMGVLLLTVFASTTAVSATHEGSGPTAKAKLEQEWQVYHDQDYSFTIEYPKGWNVETIWYDPNVESQTIAKRVTLFGPLTRINIDIRNQPREDIVEWVNQLAFLISQQQPDMKVDRNAMVAGFPAVAYLEENSQVPNILTTVFNSDTDFFQFDYMVGDSGTAIGTYLHLLESFQPQPSDNEIGDTENFQFPPDVYENTIQKSRNLAPLVDTCCGVNSPGNPFPCSNGNCTWWVWYSKGGVPMTGDAYKWGPRVAANWYPGWKLTYDHIQARVGDIAWWTFGPSRPVGHVAYITNISPSMVRVSQMVYGGENCNDEPSSRTYFFPHPDEPLGYIHNH